MKKKLIVTGIIIIFSFFAATTETFITDTASLIALLFTILGLCLTGYTFIYSPISEILKNETFQTEQANQNLKKLLKSYEEDMNLIFVLSLIIILLDVFCVIDIPVLKNEINLDLGIIKIYSLKEYIFNFIISGCAMFSFYALYDLMQATFKILRKSFEK